MSDRRNYYHGQTVMEDELDDGFNDLEVALDDLTVDTDIGQALVAASPDPTVYGGIASGLGVTWNALGYCEVAAGVAYDQLGRRIEVPTGGATVVITKTGSTDEGDDTLAEGDGALVTGSVPSGDRTIGALFLVYDEALSDSRVDATGATVQFQITRSFHFDLQIGASFTPPPGAPPGVAALADGKVLLADLVIHNTAGTLSVVAVCYNDQHWDDLGGNYVTLGGRRSDWLAIDQSATFPQFDAMNTQLRAGSARDFLYALLALLQAQGANPTGASVIGSLAQVGTVVTPPTATEAAGAKTLPAGSIQAQLMAVANALSNALFAGGGNSITPPAGRGGLFLDPDNMDADRVLLGLKSDVGGSVNNLLFFKKRGHISFPNGLYENFCRCNGTDVGGRTSWVTTTDSPWDQRDIDGGDAHTAAAFFIRNSGDGTPFEGNIVELLTGTGVGDGAEIRLGFDGTNRFGGFNFGASPWASAWFRFRLPSVAGIYIYFSIEDRITGGNSALHARYDVSGPATLQGVIDGDVAGTTSVELLSLPGGDAPTVDTWYTVRVSVLGNTTAVFQVNNGDEISAVLGADALLSTPYHLSIGVISTAGGAKALYLDRLAIAENVLPADLG